jgi:hypothetical protein
MKTDQQLQREVEEELAWDPAVNVTDIGVEVRERVVTLSGHPASYAEKLAAEKAAQRVAGVKAVVVEMNIRLPHGDIRTDEEIANAVRSMLKWTVGLPEASIQVQVEKGWVTLRGDVDRAFQRHGRLEPDRRGRQRGRGRHRREDQRGLATPCRAGGKSHWGHRASGRRHADGQGGLVCGAIGRSGRSVVGTRRACGHRQSDGRVRGDGKPRGVDASTPKVTADSRSGDRSGCAEKCRFMSASSNAWGARFSNCSWRACVSSYRQARGRWRKHAPRAILVLEKENCDRTILANRLDAHTARLTGVHPPGARDMNRRRSRRQPFFYQPTQGLFSNFHLRLLQLRRRGVKRPRPCAGLQRTARTTRENPRCSGISPGRSVRRA